MAKEESRSERPDFFAKGGTTPMFSKGHADPARSDFSGKESQGGNEGQGVTDPHGDKDEYTSGVRFIEGGSDKMFGKGHAGKKVPGISGKASQEG